MMIDGMMVPRPGIGGGPVRSPLDPSTGVYSQTSVYSGNQAASMAAMTSPTVISNTQTATNPETPVWIQVDYGEVRPMDVVRVRTPNNELVGGWGDFTYLNGVYVEISDDGVEWERVAMLHQPGGFNVIFPGPIIQVVALVPGQFIDVALGIDRSARFARLYKDSGYIATTGFYAATLTS